MTVSKIAICNMALGNVGAKNLIQDIDEQTVEARQCNLWYDHALQTALEGFDWPFARRRKTLAVDGQEAPDQWSYRYQMPAACVAFRRIWNPLGEDVDAVPFAFETNDNGVQTILTDQEDAVGIFTALVTNTAVFTSLFIDALAWQLAYRVSPKITGKRQITVDCMANFHAQLVLAEANVANQEKPGEPREAPWIAGRA